NDTLQVEARLKEIEDRAEADSVAPSPQPLSPEGRGATDAPLSPEGRGATDAPPSPQGRGGTDGPPPPPGKEGAESSPSPRGGGGAGVGGDLAAVETEIAQTLANRLLSRAAEDTPGYLVLNPCSFIRRVALELDDVNGPLPIGGHIKAGQFEGTHAKL